MIKKIQSLLFSGQKNKEDQKNVAKANQDTIEQFIEGDNLPIDEFLWNVGLLHHKSIHHGIIIKWRIKLCPSVDCSNSYAVFF